MSPRQDKAALFAELVANVYECKNCSLCEGAKNRVNGEGNLDSRVVFVGEAPGRKEDETGRPFVGSAGKLLDRLLAGLLDEAGADELAEVVLHAAEVPVEGFGEVGGAHLPVAEHVEHPAACVVG